MASATTSEFVKPAARAAAQPFSIIEQKGLARRLGAELARTADEFARDPRRFLRDLFTDDTRDAKRRRRLYYGLALGVIAHAVLVALMAVAGWHQMARVREKAEESKDITWVDPNAFKMPAEEATDGSKQPRGSDGGGGGGGTERPPACDERPAATEGARRAGSKA